MKAGETGCLICGATWGDYWENVEGKRMFFCCDVCARQFRNLINEVKKRTGWEKVSSVRMDGDYRGRVCTAERSDDSYRFFVKFDGEGDIQNYVELGK
jgi:hypothetical protein